VLLAKLYYEDEITVDEMHSTCSSCAWGSEKFLKNLVSYVKGKHLGRPRRRLQGNIKMYLKKQDISM
jgi:hypothetical protein